jgi:paraquat-inducible protein A
MTHCIQLCSKPVTAGPCVLDVFISVCHYLQHDQALPWWHLRKQWQAEMPPLPSLCTIRRHEPATIPAGCGLTLLACHECDLLQAAPARMRRGCAVAAVAASCCLGRLSAQHLAGPGAGRLLVFVLANAFPVVGLEANGVKTATTLLGTAWQLSQQQMEPVALLVLLTGVLTPGLELLCLLYLLLPLALGHAPRGFARVMRLVRVLHPWGMVEVFLLGVLVSLVKLPTWPRCIPASACGRFLP